MAGGRERERDLRMGEARAGRGRARSLFSKCAANRCNDFMFCSECTSEMGEAPSYITRVILFVSAVIANAR